MGIYIPKRPVRRRSVSETLTEAEDEHYLDCPDADLRTRTAALVLDGIFLFLMITGLNRIYHSGIQLWLGSRIPAPMEIVLFDSIQFTLDTVLYYVSNLWAVFGLGGSFGKLLLGLRVINFQTGQKLTFVQALTREAGGKIILGTATFGIGWIMPVFREDRLALHDILASSVVKKVRYRA